MDDRFEIDIKMDAGSLCYFVMYHNYMRPGGIIGFVISIAAIVALIIRWEQWTGIQRCLLVVLALLFTVIQPLLLMKKANAQVQTEAFSIPFHYEFDETSFVISQGENREAFLYTDIRKAVIKKNIMFLYMTPLSAYILPRKKCGDKGFETIREFVKNGLQKGK